MDPNSWLLLCRTVRFGDTDAAGVMHFQQLLRWCHEAYEESLERFGISAAAIFPSPAAAPTIALPIVHCQADYFAPLIVGDPLAIQLEPRRLDPGCFEVLYQFHRSQPDRSQLHPSPLHPSQPQRSQPADAPAEPRPVARALTRHLAIEAASRRRCPLPEPILRWLEASSLGQGIQPL